MKILWVGDGPDCPSGFGKATREILEQLRGQHEVTVLGINHRGDPGTVPYPVYAAAPGGDAMGVGRLIWMCDLVKPDLIVVQNDGWNIPAYVKQLRLFDEYRHVPLVAVVAVDGKNFRGSWLDGVSHAIFWTQFALDEARAGGYLGPASVISLGVDRNIYTPMPRLEAREIRGIGAAGDAFIIGNVNRNQPRKRWDLTLKFFAEWALGGVPKNAYLFLHVAPTGDTGVQIQQLASYYGIAERLILVQPPTFYGVEEAVMAQTYNCFDVIMSTTQGEGFGLTTLEAMACGVPCVVPRWSALGDWALDAAMLVPCRETAIGPPYVNVLGGIPDREVFIRMLDDLYDNPETRENYRQLGLARAAEPRFSWVEIGQRYQQVLTHVLEIAQPIEVQV